MAVLDKIILQDYRNISLQELDFSPNVNCISGNNGTGKTNLLEAVWYLSMTKSPQGVPDRYLVRHGADNFSLSGSYTLPGGTKTRISIKSGPVSGSEKTIRRDDKNVRRASDHVGLLPVVMVSPSDTAMVSESGEERRRFVNGVLSQIDRPYLSDVQRYTKVLGQRNAALKGEAPASDDVLDALDAMLGQYAARVCASREAFVGQLSPLVARYYALLSGGSETCSLEYRTDLSKGDLCETLMRNRERDRILKYTSCGPQRDDFLFLMDGFPIRRCGSQGQQKSFLVSLKFAQYEIMKNATGAPPILLLDDLFDKLDMNRTSNLLKMVAGEDFGQIFITDSNKVRLQGIVDTITRDRAYFEAESGVFSRSDGQQD